MRHKILTLLTFGTLIATIIVLINQNEKIKSLNMQLDNTQKQISIYQSDTHWLNNLAKYELEKFKHIDFIVLEDKEWMEYITNKTNDIPKLISMIQEEIIIVRKDYLNQLHLYNEYHIIDYILNNVNIYKVDTSMIQNGVMSYFGQYYEDRD